MRPLAFLLSHFLAGTPPCLPLCRKVGITVCSPALCFAIALCLAVGACSASRIGTYTYDLMNRGCKVLIFKVIFSQHILNKSLTKREINERRSLMSQHTFWLVEILLRVYIAYYQYIYYHIQQFNKNKKVLQGFACFTWAKTICGR